MIKEVFEIEPIQKNSLITLGCLTCISYLQLDLFCHHIKLDNIFTSLMLSFALSICWLIANALPCFLFFKSTMKGQKKPESLLLDRVVLVLGTLTIAWVIIFTYIGYELSLSFKNFIRISLIAIALRTLLWTIVVSMTKTHEETTPK
jgi:hypothetical protein